MMDGITAPLKLLTEVPQAAPTDLFKSKGSSSLVYLVHGVTGTPAEMRYLGAALNREGFDSYATTLPGHCQSVRDLVRTDHHQWLAHVKKQLSFLRKHYAYVFAAGLSAGASLVLAAAGDVSLDGLGVLSPTFMYDGWNTPWSNAILPLAMAVVPYGWQHWLFHIDGPPYGIKDPALQHKIRKAYSLKALWREWFDAIRPRWSLRMDQKPGTGEAGSKGYPLFPLKCLTQVDRLNEQVKQRLPDLRTPTIILQAREDDMTGPRNADLVYSRIGSARKHLITLEDCYHVLPVDKQRKAVALHLADFFRSCQTQ